MFAILLLGFLMGMRHALEADHLAAVSSIASDRTTVRAVLQHGLTWGFGQLRRLETLDGKEIVERLEAIDDAKRLYRYALVAGVPASRYIGTIEVKPKGGGCVAEWRVQFLASNQPDIIVRTIVSGLIETGFESLKSRF